MLHPSYGFVNHQKWKLFLIQAYILLPRPAHTYTPTNTLEGKLILNARRCLLSLWWVASSYCYLTPHLAKDSLYAFYLQQKYPMDKNTQNLPADQNENFNLHAHRDGPRVRRIITDVVLIWLYWRNQITNLRSNSHLINSNLIPGPGVRIDS